MLLDLSYKQQRLSQWKERMPRDVASRKGLIMWHINRKRKEAGTLCIGETESVALNVLSISQVFFFIAGLIRDFNILMCAIDPQGGVEYALLRCVHRLECACVCVCLMFIT